MFIIHYHCKDTHPVTNSNTTENITKASVNSHGWSYFIYNEENNLHIYNLYTNIRCNNIRLPEHFIFQLEKK